MAWWTNRIRRVNSSGWVVGLHWVNSSRWAEYGEAWMGKWCGGEYIHPGYHLFFAYIADHCTEKLMQAEDFQNLKINKKAFAGIFYDIFLLVKISNFGNLVCQHCSALASIGLKIGLEVNRINCCSRKVIFIFFPRKWFQSSQTEQRKKIKGQLKIRKWCWCQISPKVQDILMIRCHLELGGGKNCHLKCETFNLKFKRKFASYLPKESPFHSVEKAFKFQMLKLTPIHSLVIEIFPHNFQIHCGSNSIQFVLIL